MQLRLLAVLVLFISFIQAESFCIFGWCFFSSSSSSSTEKKVDVRMKPLIGATTTYETIDGWKYMVILKCPTGTDASDIEFATMGTSMVQVKVDKNFYTIALLDRVIPGTRYIPNLSKTHLGNDEWQITFIVPNSATKLERVITKHRDIVPAAQEEVEDEEPIKRKQVKKKKKTVKQAVPEPQLRSFSASFDG